jgi:myo-inositol catabolism protein IolC
MNLGYNLPLYLLPFDHRHSYVRGIFQLDSPLTATQRDAVIASKQVIYDGFRSALGSELTVNTAGLLIDEEFGAAILRDANRSGYVTALSTEQSGSAEFEFQYGSAFAAHIEAFQPTFAKALVRYNPEGDAALNARQTARLKQLSDWCRTVERRFMCELLVPATQAQIDRSGADQETYDQSMRPVLMLEAISALQEAGVEPDIWKIEGLDRREDCERVVAVSRRGGRDRVGCIVLGRHADEEKVVSWLRTAASVPGFIGFAVGRSTFWDAIADYVKKRTTRREAASRVARRYREWAKTFEKARQSRSSAA